jgi:hypothetical protein
MDIPLEDQEARIEKEYEVNRGRMFKGTIAVSVTYGVIALFLVVLMFLSERTKQVLGIDLFAFSVTFIAGVLLIVTLLVIQILTFKKEKPTLPTDLYQCPDYWELSETPPELVQRFPENVRAFVQYRCTPKPGVYDSRMMKTTLPSADTNRAQIKELDDAWAKFNRMDAVINNADDQMSCKQIYPGWMAAEDRTITPNNPTKMRCQYSKFCTNSAPWSGLCNA